MFRRHITRFARWFSKYKFTIIQNIILFIVFSLVLFWAIFPNNSPEWTGFGSFTSPSGEIDRAKTLWDWFSLLIIPAALAFGVWWLNKSDQIAQRELAQKREAVERQIAFDRMQNSILQNYFDTMTGLLLEKGLRSSSNEDTWIVARSQTLATLRNLKDGQLKGTLLQFLFEAGLLDRRTKSIDLKNADLTNADLFQATLTNANLSGVNLSGAVLIDAQMKSCSLKNANLTKANISNAILTDKVDMANINLTEATLNGAKMFGANIANATLVGAKLREADLTEVTLINAIMHDVELRNANLTKANLSGCLVPKAELNKSMSLSDAIMPTGNIHDNNQ